MLDAAGGVQPSCKPIEVEAGPTTILKCVPNERLDAVRAQRRTVA